ncbi:MAG: GNAT family N-acetyltransferase [Nocardioides sp.]
MPDDAFHLEFHADPAGFLQEAGPHLAADPVIGTVMASVTERMVVRTRLVPGLTPWWVVVRDQGREVVGAAMRTAPFAPHPLYLLPMPDSAAVALARALHERGEDVPAANGALPGVMQLAEETARLRGGRAEVAVHTRLFQLAGLVPPSPVEGPVVGRLRVATEADLGLATRWFEQFHADAEEQAGRHVEPEVTRASSRDEVSERIAESLVWLWEVGGVVVHLTGHSQAAFGVVRVGPVYTPREHRGRGYASAAVAELSRRIVAAGHLACLFTDQANPTSNKIYEALGYQRVVDMAEVVVTTPAPA